MSFNAKNLSYGSSPSPFKSLTFIDNATDAKEPAFLQRLKSQYGGANGLGRDAPQHRPKRLRNDDDDDAPTYVEEGSHEVISKEEYEALVRGDDPKNSEADESAAGQTEAGSNKAVPTAKEDGLKGRQNVAGIGAPKKRKQGKVVGDEASGEEEEEGMDRQERNTVANKPKQMKKKVKLSFDEPEGD